MEKRKIGTSLCYTGKLNEVCLKMLSDAGVECIEYSFSYDYYMNSLDYPRHSVKYSNMVRSFGLEPWSIHLPFSRVLDISQPDSELRKITIYSHKLLIRAAAKAGLKVVVLHPSSEPIEEDQRESRIETARASIEKLSSVAKEAGIKLAVENLPRTCLGRTSDEIIKLLDGMDAGSIFDTNHSGTEDDIHFVNALTKAGISIYSIHISDYYRDENGILDEKHVLPGEGIIEWKKLLAAISKNGYDGPLMYEVRKKPKNRTEPLPVEELVANMRALRDGKIK